MEPACLYRSAPYLAKITGKTARWLTGKAAEGEIPGAYQPGGPGSAWSFDERLFWEWWNKSERKPDPWRPSTSRKARDTGGAASNETDGHAANRLERLLGL